MRTQVSATHRHFAGFLLSLAVLCLASAAAVAQTVGASVSFMMSGDPAEKAAYDKLVDAFHRKEPAIKVNVINVPGGGAFRKRIATDFAANTMADIMLFNYRRYVTLAIKGAFEPLGPYLATSKAIKESDFYAEALAPFRHNGSLTCIPQNISSLVVYYNRTLFRQAGLADPKDDWTWDDFVKTAQALTRDTRGTGVVDQYGLGTEVSLFRLAPFIWQNGGALVDTPQPGMYPERLLMMTEPALKAVQWFVDLQVKHKVVPDAVQEKSEGSEARFLNGRLGMFLNSRRGVPTYRTIQGFDWDVAPLPRGAERAGLLHSDGFCMSAKSASKAAAWTFIEYANSVEGQTILAETGRTVPSLKSVANSPAFLATNSAPRNSRVFLDGIPHIRAVPVMPGWVEMEDAVSKDLERAMYGQISAQQAAARAIERTFTYFDD